MLESVEYVVSEQCGRSFVSEHSCYSCARFFSSFLSFFQMDFFSR